MKKQLLFLMMIMLPMVASAHDIEVQNGDGVTIYYNYTNDGKELAVTFPGSDFANPENYAGNIVIPEEVTYMNRTRKVTDIGGDAFYKCSGLTSITIPNSVTSISNSAFGYCSGLTSVTIPNSVTSIDQHAFENCQNLTSITIPNSVKSIGRFAFNGCYGLQKVIVSDIAAWCGIEFGDDDANPLYYAHHLYSDENTEIRDLVIPYGVTGIRDYAFSQCSSLTSINIPNLVTYIGLRAFYECSGLTSVTIPNSVTIIGSQAFDGVYIPTIISQIENPFTMYYGATSNYRPFSRNTFYNATLYVPKGTVEKYKATDGWKDFVFIEEIGTTPTPEKCEKPTIGYAAGKLTFASSTEGAECYYSITDTDIKSGSGSEMQLGVTYNISVYAAKVGCETSETATATLCWIDATPQTEGITNGVAQIAARPVLVKTDNGFITVEGADEGTQISAYTVDGVLAGTAVSRNGSAVLNTNLRPCTTAIVKVCGKSIKVVVK